MGSKRIQNLVLVVDLLIADEFVFCTRFKEIQTKLPFSTNYQNVRAIRV